MDQGQLGLRRALPWFSYLVLCPAFHRLPVANAAQLRATEAARLHAFGHGPDSAPTIYVPELPMPEVPDSADSAGAVAFDGGLLSAFAKARLDGMNPAANKYHAGPGDDRDADVVTGEQKDEGAGANTVGGSFGTCSQACHQCFVDHYQGCLAYCHVGCEDYCATRLSAEECDKKSEWTATVAHVFQAFDPHARMCASTGFNGCPFNQADHPKPKSPPVAPYPSSAAAEGNPSMENSTKNKTVLEATNSQEQSQYHQELLLATETIIFSAGR